ADDGVFTMRRLIRPGRWPAFALLLIAATPAAGQEKGAGPTSLFDRRLLPIRRASVAWESRQGPSPKGVDGVCTAPDVSTFLTAISAWDEGHYFPILIDDPETNLKFLRAFKPARVVRPPKRTQATGRGVAWREAAEAVGLAWSSSDRGKAPSGEGP